LLVLGLGLRIHRDPRRVWQPTRGPKMGNNGIKDGGNNWQKFRIWPDEQTPPPPPATPTRHPQGFLAKSSSGPFRNRNFFRRSLVFWASKPPSLPNSRSILERIPGRPLFVTRNARELCYMTGISTESWPKNTLRRPSGSCRVTMFARSQCRTRVKRSNRD